MLKTALPHSFLIGMLAILLVACGRDPTTTVGNTPPLLSSSTVPMLQHLGLMGQAIARDPEILAALNTATQAVVILPDNAALPTPLTPELLRRYVLPEAITANGTYTTLAKTRWVVTTYPQELRVNGVLLGGCASTQNSSGGTVTLCLSDGLLPDP